MTTLSRPTPRSAIRPGVLALGLLAAACSTAPRPHPPAVEAARAAEERAERPPAPTTELPVGRSPEEAPVVPVDSAPPDPGSRPLAELTGGPKAVPERVVAVIDDLRFAPGSTTLDHAARSRLAALAQRLRSLDGGFRIEIQGHTDSTGDAIANLRTALERAESVRLDLLRRSGLPVSRFSVVALGAAHPLADNSTSGGRARNRRVAVLVLR